jgi:hypothetical protein
MAPDDPAGTRPAPVVLRIKLRYDDVEAMTEHFAPNVGRSGLFLPTRSMQPVGTEVKFELRLASDQPVLVGLGRVQSAQEPDPADPAATYGLGIELMRVTREGRELILKLLARRRQLGLPEVALPRAEEIDAARRAAEVAAVPQPIGPVAIPKATSIAPLPAEPPRRSRRSMGELIESASGSIASSLAIPGLDEEVDIGRALARARALATGDLDEELEQLRDRIAAPLAEISIEEASAALARQFGGVAVRRDRSQGWAPPPAVEARAESVAARSEAVVAEDAPAAVEDSPAAVEDSPAAVEHVAAALEPPEPEPEPSPDEGVIERDEEDLAHLRTESERRAFAPANVDQITTEPIVSLALDEGQLAGAIPQVVEAKAVEAAAEDEYKHEAEAEAEERDDDDDDEEHTEIGSLPVDPNAADPSFVGSTADVFGAAAMYRPPFAAGLDGSIATMPFHGLGAPSVGDDLPEDLEMEVIEEIDEFEILAEADADDADLLTAYGEGELATSTQAPPPAAAHPSQTNSDFAARLDLDDDSDFYTAVPAAVPTAGPGDRRAEHDRAPLTLADADAPGHFDEPNEFDEPHAPRAVPLYARHTSPGYAAGPQPPRDPEDEFSSHHVDFAPAHPVDQGDGLEVPPERRRDRPSGSASDSELETALDALDVDLDDISVTDASTELQRTGVSSLRLEGRRTLRPPAAAVPQRTAPTYQSGSGRVVRPANTAPSNQDDSGRVARPARATPSSPVDSGRVARPARTTPSGRVSRPRTDDGILIDFDDVEDDDKR